MPYQITGDRPFAEQLVQANSKEDIEEPHAWHFVRGVCWQQSVSNVKSISML